MSFEMTNAFKRVEARPLDRYVAYMLADCCNEKTRRCDPSWATLIDLTSLSRRTIASSIGRLEKEGHLTVVRKKGFRPSYKLHPRVTRSLPRTHDDPQGAGYASAAADDDADADTGAPHAPPPCISCTPPVQDVHVPRAPHAPETEGTRIQPESTRREGANALPPPLHMNASSIKTNTNASNNNHASAGPGASIGMEMKATADARATPLDPAPSRPQRKGGKSRQRATAPVPPESQRAVEAFASELGLSPVDGRWFWLKHEETGWRKGNGAPVLDWRATMRTWEAGGYFPSQKQRPGPGMGTGTLGGDRQAVRAPACFDLSRPRPVMTL